MKEIISHTKENRKILYAAICVLTAFLIWTVAIQFIDVQPIGPKESLVGFGRINQFVHKFTGVHFSLYTITDWLSIIPFGIIAGFGILGLIQWIKRKHLLKVDYSILVLGGFYIIVMILYALFEVFVVNYRPVLINECLEASYPSSTTMLAMCVMPTAIMQFNERIGKDGFRHCISFIAATFTVFMVIARLISGVHWITDIIGGILLSTGLVLMYVFANKLNVKNKSKG